jgi:hypothetical protein
LGKIEKLCLDTVGESGYNTVVIETRQRKYFIESIYKRKGIRQEGVLRCRRRKIF